MHPNQGILLRVSASGRGPGQYRLGVSAAASPIWPDIAPTELTTASFSVPTAGDGEINPQTLALAVTGAGAAGQQLLSRLAENSYTPILLDLRAETLYSAPWEAAVGQLPLANLGGGIRWFARYSPKIADLALVPLRVPIDVLVAELTSWPVGNQRLVDEPFLHPLAHFRTVIASRLDAEGLREILRGRSYDVVHLRARAARDDEGAGLTSDSQLVRGKEMQRLLSLRGCAARLVILETDRESLPAMRDIAHRILGRSGPTVAVVETGTFDFREFYYDITHDVWLPGAIEHRSFAVGPDNHVALLMARGGEEILQISSVETLMRNQSDVGMLRIQHVIDSLHDMQATAPSDFGSAFFQRHLNAILGMNADVERLRGQVYSFNRETDGIEPMSQATSELDQLIAALPDHEAQVQRVVNTWFVRDGLAVPGDRSLARDTTYLLQVTIGPHASESVIRTPVAIPEEELADHYSDDGLVLRVVLFSNDFQLIDQEQELRLPRPPSSSLPVTFRVTTPGHSGEARLRVGVYFRNNLLQSVMLSCAVTESEAAPHRTGIVGEVEWVLSESLRDIERFDEKAVTFLTNESSDGTHMMAAVGTGFRQQFALGETELHTMITEARGALQWICGDPAKNEDYRFEPNNRGDKGRFREFISGLAEFGYDLYTQLVTMLDADFESRLSAALKHPATIQAASMKSAKFVFPWTLVYDLPVIPHPTNQVCPDFLAAVEQGATADDLARLACFTDGCSYRADTNVVCPSGFWGFRHVIEQPLAATVDDNDPSATGMQRGDAVESIHVPGAAQVLMGYSQALKHYKEHRQEVTSLAYASADPRSDLFELGRGLQRTDLHFVYFYCHGGHRRGKAWLGVGAKPPDLLYPSNLKAWEVSWPLTRPLVFINGCDTVGVTPDDLLTFNRMLVWCKASGVVGSEITIPETFGRAFGNRFLKGFLAGERVGDLVRRIRLEYLADYNPLGLAYTPYCLAKLQVVYG